jgi:hypothetical protein
MSGFFVDEIKGATAQRRKGVRAKKTHDTRRMAATKKI